MPWQVMVRVRLGEHIKLPVASALISVPLALVSVVEKNSLPGTQVQCDIQVTTVYLPQVFPGTRISTRLKGRMDRVG